MNGLFIKLIFSLKMNRHRHLCLFLCELYNIKYISYLLNISKLDSRYIWVLHEFSNYKLKRTFNINTKDTRYS